MPELVVDQLNQIQHTTSDLSPFPSQERLQVTLINDRIRNLRYPTGIASKQMGEQPMLVGW